MTYRVNLLPTDLIEERAFDKRSLLRLAATGAAGSLVAVYILFLVSYFVISGRILHCELQLRVVQPRAQKVQKLIDERRNAEAAAEALQQVLGGRQTWTDLLDDLAFRLPVDTWLTRVTICSDQAERNKEEAERDKQKEVKLPPPPDTLLIEGASLSVPSIGVTVKNLTSLGYFRRVWLEEFHRVEDGSLKFRIRAELERANR